MRIPYLAVLIVFVVACGGPQVPGYTKRHLEAFVAAMQDAEFTTEDMRMVLSENFSRLLGVPKVKL